MRKEEEALELAAAANAGQRSDENDPISLTHEAGDASMSIQRNFALMAGLRGPAHCIRSTSWEYPLAGMIQIG